MRILAFNTLEDTELAVKKIWVETVRDVISEKTSEVWDGQKFITDVSGWSDDEIAGLMICGEIEGRVQTIDGLTIRYSRIQKSAISENWYFKKCEDEYLKFIANYTIMELPLEWSPTIPYP